MEQGSRVFSKRKTGHVAPSCRRDQQQREFLSPHPHPLPNPPQQRSNKMIQIQLSPHPHPLSCPFPKPPQQNNKRMIHRQELLFPHLSSPPHPHPQLVAVKSLMLNPPFEIVYTPILCGRAYSCFPKNRKNLKRKILVKTEGMLVAFQIVYKICLQLYKNK